MKRVIFRLSVLCGAVVIAALLGTSASAAVIGAGSGEVAPDVFSSDPTGSVLAHRTQTVTTPDGDSATLVTAVVRDTSTGGLDFLYQWTAASTNGANFTETDGLNFGAYTTDVGYINTGTAVSAALTAAGFVTPSGASVPVPTDVERSIDGNTVDWENWLTSGLANFNPGDVSAILEVQTNATAFGSGFAAIIDGGAANAVAYQPVPEPWSLLVWAGFGGLAAVYQWRRRRTK
jgi:hypothetical protein